MDDENLKAAGLIVVNTAGGKWGVKFAFELKDSFKETFPSARWNQDERQWEVGTRSKQRLDDWLEVIYDTQLQLHQIKIHQEIGRINDLEVSKIKAALAVVEEVLSKKREETGRFSIKRDELRSLLSSGNHEVLPKIAEATDWLEASSMQIREMKLLIRKASKTLAAQSPNS